MPITAPSKKSANQSSVCQVQFDGGVIQLSWVDAGVSLSYTSILKLTDEKRNRFKYAKIKHVL